MFWPLVWSSSGGCVTEDGYIEILCRVRRNSTETITKDIWSSHRGVNEDLTLQKCYTIYTYQEGTNNSSWTGWLCCSETPVTIYQLKQCNIPEDLNFHDNGTLSQSCSMNCRKPRYTFRWCLLFSHPADFTPVCTTELGRIAVHDHEFKKRGVKVIAHSCDKLKSHSDWVAVSHILMLVSFIGIWRFCSFWPSVCA